jgi:phage shock protein PspC (stress-responsive transcriptional regulator)
MIAGMTNEQPRIRRILRRRADDRVIGGVASGLGDYFNVDPLLIRIGFVGLMVFGGMGIFLYVAAWLLVPDDATNQSVVERVVGRGGLGGTLITIALVVVAAAVLFSIFPSVSDRGRGFPLFWLALAVVVVGVLVLRRAEPTGSLETDTAAPVASATTASAATDRTVVRRPRRAPSPLGGYVIGTGLAAIGALALIANVTGAVVTPGQYFGLALVAIGIGLVVGTWWGHARGLILLGLLLLPFAFAASFVTAPLEGGFGDQRFSPASLDELEDEYRLAGGDLVLDLTDIDGGSPPIEIVASVGMGRLLVLLPDDAGAEIDASIGAGDLFIADGRERGTRISEREVIEGDGQQFRLDLEAGIGRIRVETIATEDR